MFHKEQDPLTEYVRVDPGEEPGGAAVAEGGGADELVAAAAPPGDERAARVALAGVDAAVGEDARAQHVGGEGAGVRPPAVAGGPVDDAHCCLGTWEESYKMTLSKKYMQAYPLHFHGLISCETDCSPS